jgi:hypothetical protein
MFSPARDLLGGPLRGTGPERSDRRRGPLGQAAAIGILTLLVAAQPLRDPAVIIDLGLSLAPLSYEVLEAAPPGEVMPRVAAVLTGILGVEPPAPVMLHTYTTRDALRHGLIRHAGLSPAAALDLAATSLGLALPRMVLLRVGADDGDRVRLLAHETMHLIQLELSGTERRPAQWLMEGTAEWAAIAVLARVQAADVDERRRAALAAADRYLTRHPTFTPAGLRLPEAFTRWRRAIGDVLAYQVAYALADRLVERHGVHAVVRYFRGFRDVDEASVSFQRAFGRPIAAFMADVRDAIRGTAEVGRRPAPPPDTVPSP